MDWLNAELPPAIGGLVPPVRLPDTGFLCGVFWQSNV
jgi:hypothetical protein